MAVLGRLLLGSAERLDLPDLLSVDSFAAGDFKYLIQSFIGSTQPYILRGFDVIQPQDSVGTESISIRIADSVVYYPAATAGSFFYGLEEGNENAQPLVPELRKNATNYVYLTFSTFDTASDSRAFWDPDQNGGAGGEFSQDINTESALQVEVNVSVSTFPENTIPICKVVVGATVIESIQDSRNMMFRLGTGGVTPDPFSAYDFRTNPSSSYARSEPPTTIASALDPNPFQGGDKNIFTLKEWMDVVMTRIKEISGETYWYSSGSVAGGTSGAFNIHDTWEDAVGSTLKSKGQLLHDESIAGRLTWTEDIQYHSLTDPRVLLIRANTVDIVNNDEIAYIDIVRDEEFNTSSTAVTWQNGTTTVNGIVGSFENLSKGDWVKKISDPNYYYIRIEEFYALPGQAGGVTTPTLAQSIKLSSTYLGANGDAISEFTKGEYILTDINIEPRNTSSIDDIGGNFFWLAYRSDTSLGLQGITPVQLLIDITDADGTIATCTAAAHGLEDGDSIEITTGGYAGTYKISVEDVNTFYISTSVTGDELSQDAFYAIVETKARWSQDDPGLNYQLESANHGFESGQRVIISNTTSAYDNSYIINKRTDTTFQIPISSLIPNPGTIEGEIVTLVRINARTDFGVIKIIQGESIDIGDADSGNVLSYIGMPSLAVSKPTYNLSLSYNALNGMQNYNTNSDDDLTERAAKLTAMMADRVQERDIVFSGRTGITNTTLGLNQIITATNTITIHKPSSPDQVITLDVNIPANSVAVAAIDRDGSAGISLSVESLDNAFTLEENKLIMFYRFNDNNVYTWDGAIIPEFGSYYTVSPEDTQSKNVRIFNSDGVIFNSGSGLITLENSSDISVLIPGSTDNSIDVSTINGLGTLILADGQSAWIRIDRDNAKIFNTIDTVNSADTTANGKIYITSSNLVPIDQNVFVLWSRDGDNLIHHHIPNSWDESQIVARTLYDQIATSNRETLDTLLASINEELTKPLRILPSSTPDLTVTVDSILVTNPETGRNITIPSIANTLPNFTGGSVIFPAVAGGTILVTPGDNSTLTMSVNSFLKVGLNLNALGNLTLSFGVEGISEAAATVPPTINNTFSIGYVVVETDGASNVQNINGNNIYQYSGGGGGNGSGDASTIGDFISDYHESSPYALANSTVYGRDEDDNIDVASTSSYSIANSSVVFSAAAENLITNQQLDLAEFIEEDVGALDLLAFWKEGLADTAATYEVSRDGGNEYQSVTMKQVGNTSYFRGTHTFIEESANQELDGAPPQDSAVDLDEAAGNDPIAQQFTLTEPSVIKELVIALDSNTGTPEGNITVSIVRDDFGFPSYDTLDLLASTSPIDVTTLTPSSDNTLTIPATPLAAGTYHFVVTTDAQYKAAAALSNFISLATNSVADGSSVYDFSWSSESAAEANPWNGITWSEELSLFVAVSASGTNQAMTSPDGATWSPQSIQAESWRNVTWSPDLNLFVAVGVDAVSTSPDGVTWTPQTAAEANTWESVVWASDLGLFVAVASTGTNRVMTSPDGVTWSPESAAEANLWRSVTWAEELGLLVAVSSDGTNRVMTSPDGSAWTSQSASEASAWQEVVWADTLNLFVAIASSGTNQAMTSPDGFTWTSRTIAANAYQSLTYGSENNTLVAISTGNVSVSSDGINWIEQTPAEANSWSAVTYAPELNLFAAVSATGTNRVMTSPQGWGDNGTIGAYYEILGRELNLKLRITSSQGNVELEGHSVHYSLQPGKLATGSKEIHTEEFLSNSSNEDTFTMPFLPEPDLLRVYNKGSGQVYRHDPAGTHGFKIDGNDVIFPADTFDQSPEPDELVKLVFDQTNGGSFDNSDQNANDLGLVKSNLAEGGSLSNGPILATSVQSGAVKRNLYKYENFGGQSTNATLATLNLIVGNIYKITTKASPQSFNIGENNNRRLLFSLHDDGVSIEDTTTGWDYRDTSTDDIIYGTEKTYIFVADNSVYTLQTHALSGDMTLRNVSVLLEDITTQYAEDSGLW